LVTTDKLLQKDLSPLLKHDRTGEPFYPTGVSGGADRVSFSQRAKGVFDSLYLNI